MHPILFTIRLPDADLRVFPGLCALAVLGLCLAGYTYWRRIPGLTAFGFALAATAAVAAYRFRDASLTLDSFAVPAWGTLLGCWLIGAWHFARATAQRLALDRETMGNCFVVSALSGLVAARAVYVLGTLAAGPDLDPLALRQGGLSGIGAVWGASLGAALFLRQRALSFWNWLDVSAPCLALGVTIVRAGCYLQGCDFGTRLSKNSPGWLAALGTFPRWGDPDQNPVFGAPAWIQQLESGEISALALHAWPVHPTELYEAVLGLVLAVVCLFGFERRRFHGQLGLGVLFVYALMRFVTETLRGDLTRGAFGPYLESRVALPVGLALFALAYSYGPAHSVVSGRQRYALIAASLAPAAVALGLTWHDHAPPAQLSVTQWMSLATALLTGYFWPLRAPRGLDSAAPEHQPE